MLKFETKEDLKNFLESYKFAKRKAEFLYVWGDDMTAYELGYCERTLDAVEFLISMLDDDNLKFVLFLRYIESKKICEIANFMNYSEVHIKFLLRTALDELFVVSNLPTISEQL